MPDWLIFLIVAALTTGSAALMYFLGFTVGQMRGYNAGYSEAMMDAGKITKAVANHYREAIMAENDSDDDQKPLH